MGFNKRPRVKSWCGHPILESAEMTPDEIGVIPHEGEPLRIKIETRSISTRPTLADQQKLTPRDIARVRLHIDIFQRMQTAMIFGAPITRERAEADALSALSERDRALLAEDVTEQ